MEVAVQVIAVIELTVILIAARVQAPLNGAMDYQLSLYWH